MEEKYNFLTTDTKNIFDIVHGHIALSNFAIKIINTPYFQRLRDLKQLGTCEFIFPSAVHTRFEHSIGTYYLANRLLQRIVIDTKKETLNKYIININELHNYFVKRYDSVENGQFDNYIVELIKIAALCHDIGHGPFSHSFDFFLNQFEHKNYFDHEYRSGLIVDAIISEDLHLSEIVGEGEIEFIKNLINPCYSKHTGFVYQIVSNTLNDLDVDKYDYLMRDMKMIYGYSNVNFNRLIDYIKIINNNITYSKQSYPDIINLFYTRKTLFENIYCHPKSISMQHIIIELITEINKIINIVENINSLDFFLKLTNNFILKFPDFNRLFFGKNKNIDFLNNMIKTHTLYPFITKKVTSEQINFLEVLKEKLSSDEKNNNYISNILIFKNKIGFVSGNKKNPLEHIYVYDTKDILNNNMSSYLIKKNNDSLIIPECFQEYITLFFYKEKDINTIKYLKKIIDDI